MSLDSSFNPYASPQIAPAPAEAGQESLFGVRRALERTRPWLVFLAVLGFILAGLTALGGLLGFVVMASGAEPAVGFLVGAMYFAIAAVYFFPSVFMIGYVRRIGGFLRSNSMAALEQAIAAQFRIWLCLGIMGILWIALMVVACLVMAVGIAAAGRF
jgi:hypothetical protein